MLLLGVNVDHIATIREARKVDYPDPVEAAILVQMAGAEQITIHLHEDRRHIQDRDLEIMSRILKVPLNLELALNDDVIALALKYKPERVCIVPEKREEVTTEGGLDVTQNTKKLLEVIPMFKEAGIETSLFINPDDAAIEASYKVKAEAIELHTGAFANAKNENQQFVEIERIDSAIETAISLAEPYDFITKINLGHGLNYQNLAMLLETIQIEFISELNIGHSIVARAVYVGLEQAIKEMKEIIWRAELGQNIMRSNEFYDSIFMPEEDFEEESLDSEE
ncbi:MAG: pyridoxine 5'-phosphate synthase [Planctomycetes bacterium]|nr:pyridoxine 5'-phosphate synthase [Planctomycetota bacterium]